MNHPLSINSLGAIGSSLYYNTNSDHGQERCVLKGKPGAAKNEQKQMLELIDRQLRYFDELMYLNTQLEKLQKQRSASRAQGHSSAAERTPQPMNWFKEQIHQMEQVIKTTSLEFEREHGITLPTQLNESIILIEFRETLKKGIGVDQSAKNLARQN